MATSAKHWQREQHSTVNACIVANGAQAVIDFATEVLNARVLYNMLSDDKKTVRHSSLKIGDSVVMVEDGTPELPAVPTRLYVYVEDVDKIYEKAVSKGLESVNEPKDEFWGDRMAGVKDSAGNSWMIATHKFMASIPEYSGSHSHK